MKGWLLQQLPPVMARDPVLAGFVLALEEVADSVRERVDGLEQQLDVDLATAEMFAYVASWLGVPVAPSDSGERQRALVRAVGQTLGWRGTRYGVEALLTAATGSRVVVTDGGGVFGAGVRLGAPDPVVTVTVDETGGLDEEQIRAFLAAELPLGAELRLHVRFPSRPAREQRGGAGEESSP